MIHQFVSCMHAGIVASKIIVVCTFVHMRRYHTCACDNTHAQRRSTALWLQALQVEMTGGDYGMLRFELDAPKVNPIKAHSGDRCMGSVLHSACCVHAIFQCGKTFYSTST